MVMALSDQKHLEGLKSKAEKASVSNAPVSDFMSKNPVLIQDGTKIYNAIQTLTAHHVGSAPVVNKQNKIIGVISEHDLLLQTATRDVREAILFTPRPITLAPETPLKDALVLLYKKKVRRIPVVAQDQTVIGTVTRMDVLLKLIGKN
jgi:CBS domain-containing protein